MEKEEITAPIAASQQFGIPFDCWIVISKLYLPSVDAWKLSLANREFRNQLLCDEIWKQKLQDDYPPDWRDLILDTSYTLSAKGDKRLAFEDYKLAFRYFGFFQQVDDAKENVLAKILIVGTWRTGKSSFASRMVSMTEPVDQMRGSGFKPLYVKPANFSSLDVSGLIQVWDVNVGQKFATLTSSYYRNTDAIIILFDVKTRQTFLDIPGWIKEVRSMTPHNPVLFLCGNQVDGGDRVVSTEEALELAKNNGLEYMETSCATGFGVKPMFLRVACYAVLSHDKRAANNPVVNVDKQKKKSSIGTFFQKFFK